MSNNLFFFCRYKGIKPFLIYQTFFILFLQFLLHQPKCILLLRLVNKPFLILDTLYRLFLVLPFSILFRQRYKYYFHFSKSKPKKKSTSFGDGFYYIINYLTIHHTISVPVVSLPSAPIVSNNVFKVFIFCGFIRFLIIIC